MIQKRISTRLTSILGQGIIAALFALWATAAGAQTIMPAPVFTGLDNSGNPVSGGKLCSYLTGLVTPQPTYTDSTLALANANPVILDSAGRAKVFLTQTIYGFVLRTPGTDATCATGSVLWSVDGIGAVPSASANVDVLGTAGANLAAGQPAYLSDGSGGLTAGQWFTADAATTYKSTLPIVGIAPAAIGIGASGSIRLSGTVTGLAGLTIGTTYYIVAGGGLTSTAPTNRRRMGVANTVTSLVMDTAVPGTAMMDAPNTAWGYFSAPVFRTVTGVTASTPTATPVTLFSAAAAGRYDVFVWLPGAGSANYTSYAIVLSEGSDARISGSSGGLLTVTLSGTNVQATQGSGGNAVISYAYVKIN
jgi:hypothetical protein